MQAQQPLRLALLGAGIFMQNIHLPALKVLIQEGKVEIKAVYSRSKEHSEELAHKIGSKDISIYFGEEESLKELLGRDDIDAVDVVLPINALADTVRLCMKHGKHVHSEKPVAPDVESGVTLLKEYHSQHAKLIWHVGENYRHVTPYKKAAEAVKSGRIGKVITAQYDVNNGVGLDNKYYNTQWRKDPGYQGGFLLDGGVHFVALARMILGEIEEVSAEVMQMKDYLPPADTFTSSLRFGSHLMSFNVTFALPQSLPQVFTIFGENGTVKITGKSDVEISVQGAVEKPVSNDNEWSSILEELREFVSAAQSRKSSPDSIDHSINTPEEALQDVAVVQAILESGKTGKRTKVERIVHRT